MPTSLHPQARFDPISPDLDLYGLVDRCANFEWVVRISIHQIRNLGPEEFEKLVMLQVINGGKPLVIEGWNEVLPKDIFSREWLETIYDKKHENVRDIGAGSDIPMTTGHYLRSMKQLASQWTTSNYRDERRQRLYLKDIDCPPEWQEQLQKVIPPNLFYMNENVTDRGGGDKRNTDIFGGASEATAACAGDLMSSLPQEMRAQNLMCYIGHEGTYTPAHREMCASLGQNIMVEASGKENGEKEGSSIWFMTETKDREVVREYFLSMLGHDVEIEKHFAQINAWKKATFPVYIVDQRPGDFILIPPLAPHQVWNRGTRTMKVAWNRTTAETLDLALHEALPKARLVCRDEQYKNKAIIYYTLKKYHQRLQEAEEKSEMSMLGFEGFGQEVFRSSPRFKQLTRDFRHLFGLFTEVITDEMFATKERAPEYVEFDSCVSCSYCRCNIFNRFLTCKNCVRTLTTGDEDAYDICMECYAMGRSCLCQSDLKWCEQFKWLTLVTEYENFRTMVIKNDGFVDMELSPQPLEIAWQQRTKKSTAHICQEALKRRPFKDISQPEEEKVPSESEQEPDLDDEGRPKKKKKKYRRKAKKGDLRRCHVCCHKDYSYRVHDCSNPQCKESYCYGVLYRAFDMMPQTVLENENWLCPKCLGICNCGACRRAQLGDPYMPKNTLLGHDTKAVADDRSVELLVDFRVHNLNWLKAMGEDGRTTTSKRMKNLREQADTAKAQDSTGTAAEETIANAATASMSQIGPGQVIDGYGDQSHVFGGQQYPGANGPDPQDGHHEVDQPAIPLDPDETMMTADLGDDSAYPDPMMLGGQRMLGMGYYDQDSGPDQILFDPFQIPSADALVFEEEAEVVKKAIRAQKRRAKQQDEDDPDFMGPKHHRKRRKDNVEMSSVDPALFGGGGQPGADASAVDVTINEDESVEPSAQLTQEAEDQAGRQRQAVFLANVPSLRHAKPILSYAEADEPLMEDPDDVLPAWTSHTAQRKSREHVDPPVLGAEPNDVLAGLSAEVRELLEQNPQAGHEDTEGGAEPKRRGPGRPPGKPKAAVPATRSSEKLAGPSAADIAARRRAARANRRSGVELADDSELLYEEAQPADETVNLDDDSDAESAQDFEDDGADDDDYRKPSVSRRQRNELKPGPKPAPKPATESGAKRPRGRPPKVKNQELSAPDERRQMSMAERMAARGKKFKIGNRGGLRNSRGGKIASRGSTTPHASTANEAATLAGTVNKRVGPSDDVFPETDLAFPGEAEPVNEGGQWRSEAVDEDFQVESPSPSPSAELFPGPLEPEPSPPPRVPVKAKPTIVRLGSHPGSESEGGGADKSARDDESASASVSDDDSSDGDIPNAPVGRSVRGRGIIRGMRGSGGRGRGRGRPRGRPRGS
ncbi:hypothetical protein ACHAQH_002819 [Verticillium albo-atrum]